VTETELSWAAPPGSLDQRLDFRELPFGHGPQPVDRQAIVCRGAQQQADLVEGHRGALRRIDDGQRADGLRRIAPTASDARRRRDQTDLLVVADCRPRLSCPTRKLADAE
jgi:hypothetical protein